MMITLHDLKGVGPKTLEQLARLDIFSIEDLLFHLPIRYEDRSSIKTIASLKPGDRALIEADVDHVVIVGKRRQLSCQVHDSSASLTLKFFHFTAYQKKNLEAPEAKIRCLGECRQGYRGGYEMVHPEYAILPNTNERLALSDRLIPIYPTTQGLNQAILRKLVKQVLVFLKDVSLLAELLPEALRAQFFLPMIRDAILYVHEPPLDADQELLQEGRHPMQRRLAFEELLAHQLSLTRVKVFSQQLQAQVISQSERLAPQLLNQLPFKLTGAQQRVLAEVGDDLAGGRPMLRLVQGDVGSGKTIVAAIAALQAIEAGYQVAIMAPTEILAEQHRRNFTAWFDGLKVSVGFLVGGMGQRERREVLSCLLSGEIQCVVGTHALFQEGVEFQRLTLIIVDEQHRFGVHQRLSLQQKGLHEGCHPHQLVMTATPIPRTLAMTAYADLDCSVIDELPPGRQPIQTLVVSQQRREQVIARLQASCMAGKQAYWVCTLIDESEVLQCEAALATWQVLSAALTELKVGLVHGRMKADEKEAMMQAFKTGELQVLVATTVIEVGVDVPNASLMVIENPERLGLSQLHQLRGRVGRGVDESFCVLLYGSGLSPQAEQRLAIMRQTSDGFEIAEEDLKMRGPGEVLGTRQSGLMRFKISDLLRDQDLLEEVKRMGLGLLKQYPHQIDKLLARWLQRKDEYLKV